VLIGLLVLESACFAAHPQRLSEIRVPSRVRLEAAAGFAVRPQLGEAAAQGTCTARALEGELLGLGTDTLVFRRFAFIGRPVGGRACEWTGASVVVPSETPSLAVREVRFSPGRTIYAVVVAIPIFVAVGIALSAEQVP